MAQMQGGLVGELSKKVGGFIYSRNASGAYVKAMKKPTNPKSAAQIRARTVFRNAGKGFATLTADQQSQWQNFCLKIYNPFKNKNHGQYTASQAYTALKAAMQNQNELIATTTISAFGGVTHFSGLTFDMMTQNQDAPLSSVSPEIVDTTGIAASMELIGAYIDSSKICTVDIRFRGLQGPGLGQGDFIDLNGIKYGFSAYLSDPVKFQNARVRNQFHACMAFSGLVTFGTDDLTGYTGVRITFDTAVALARYKALPQNGQWFQITLGIIGFNGTQTQLGSSFAEFGTSAPAIPS